MQTFKDRFDQTWEIELDLFKVKKIEEYDFGPAIDSETEQHIKFFPPQENLFNEIITDSRFVFGIIWCLVRDNLTGKTFKARDDDGELVHFPIQNELDFARCFDGDTLVNAELALYEEIPLFFPKMRTTLQSLIGRYKRVLELGDERLTKEVQTKMNDQEILKIMDEHLKTEEDQAIEEVEKILNKA